MNHLYLEALERMEECLRVFESRVPSPKLVPIGGHLAFRYTEKTILQAIVQKLARLISGLRTALLLLTHGFLQEHGALQRMIDEFREDVTFLSLGVIYGDTDLHTRYLEAFYQEEFDKSGDPVNSSQERPMIPRKKIQAYIAQCEAAAMETTQSILSSRTMSKAYSGFVHGASPHIMEMYGGSPIKFHVPGMLGTPRIKEHERDMWNYFYRGILAFWFAAKAFGDRDLSESIRKYCDHFESDSGKDYSRG